MIKKYTKKDGSTAYMFSIYLGKDPITNKEKRTTRRGFKTKREANIALSKIRMETQKNGLTRSDITYLSELYPLWLEQYRLTVKESTLLNVINRIKNSVLPYFENVPLKKITIPYAQKIVNEWFKKYKSYKLTHAYVNLLFNYAVKLKLIRENPFKLVTLPQPKENEEADYKYYTSDELKEFLQSVKKENNPLHYVLYRTLAFTGIRKGELLALTWNDIDFEKGTININKTIAKNLKRELITQTPKTKKSKRIISIDPITLKTLKEWRKWQKEESLKYGYNTINSNSFVFTQLNSNKLLNPESVTHYYKRYCKENNFKYIKLHGFRHTHCSLLFEAGASIQEVQERLGHSNIQTTMDIYAHVTDKQRDNLADKFAKYIGNLD